MERLDFCSVTTIIRNYISEDRGTSQTDFLYELFNCFMEDEDNMDFCFDNGLVCRWLKGQAKISPRITAYYISSDAHKEQLATDIEQIILPHIYDTGMVMLELRELLLQDNSISDMQKMKLNDSYSNESREKQALFISTVLLFGMERNFVKKDAMTREHTHPVCTFRAQRNTDRADAPSGSCPIVRYSSQIICCLDCSDRYEYHQYTD